MKKNGKKKTAGRPTKFKKQYCKAIIDFFYSSERSYINIEHYGKDGKVKWVDKKLVAPVFPSFLDFSRKIGVDTDTVVEWAKPENTKKYPGFSVAYAQAKEIQKKILIENALNGTYNPQFAIFLAKNITDMKDKQEFDHNPEGKAIVIKTVSYRDSGK